MSNISILGAGWGTAFAIMCVNYGHNVSLWSPFKEEIETIKRDGENKKLLPGVKVPTQINLTNDISIVKDADIIVFATPSFAIRQTAKLVKEYINPNIIITCIAKGLEEDSLKRLSEVLEEELPSNKIVVLSGPSHAEEVSRGVPTTVVVASKDKDAALLVQDTFMNPTFRIYANPDVIGVELGGALKNCIALAAGICDGLKLGDNTKAALMTRGISEMARLGVAMGGNSKTFAGLSGIGDLIVTCTSMHSRNRRAGILIGEGMTAKQAIEAIGMTVEGYRTTHAAYELAKKINIEMPIVNEIYKVLYEDKKPNQAIKDLMGREKKHENEDQWLYQKK